jgi:hypothetical protein
VPVTYTVLAFMVFLKGCDDGEKQGISGFLDFIHRLVFEGTRPEDGNWICFRPQVKGGVGGRRHLLSWAP